MEDDEEERGPELSWRGLSWGEALNQAKKTGRSPVFHNVPVLLNDWAHVARKGQTGLFGKKMKNREKYEDFVRATINDLHDAPSEEAHEGLTKKVLDVWRFIGEGAFATYFERIYLTHPWNRWYVGALPFGASSGQQGIEAGHGADKTILGKNALRVSPGEFFASSLPRVGQKCLFFSRLTSLFSADPRAGGHHLRRSSARPDFARGASSVASYDDLRGKLR